MKKTLKFSLLFLIFTFLFAIFTSNNTKVVAVSNDQFLGKVQLGGDTIGIQIKTKVEIVGKYEVVVNEEKLKPWENSDINEEDYIYILGLNIKKKRIDDDYYYFKKKFNL